MVAQFGWYLSAILVPLVGQSSSQFLRLPPVARFRLLGALFLLTVGGITLVLFTWLALRIGRRNLRRLNEDALPRWSPSGNDDWARRPLTTKPSAKPNLDDK